MGVIKHPPLVWETSTTTGTGDFTLAGAKSPYRTFDDALATGEVVPYTIRMGTAYECGYGYFTAPSTLARSVVVSSSNSNSAVNWAAGTKDVYISHADAVPVRHNFAATAPPDGTVDNADAGYGVGSLWVGDGLAGAAYSGAYVCVRAERSSASGAQPDAEWYPIIGSPAVARSQDGTEMPYIVVDQALRTEADCVILDNAVVDDTHATGGSFEVASLKASFSRIGGMHGRLVTPTTDVFGFGNLLGGSYGEHQYHRIGLTGETTDATPLQLFPLEDTGAHIYVQADSVQLLTISVAARDDAGDVVSTWRWSTTVKRQGTGNPAIVGTNTPAVVGQDAGAAAWAVALTIDNTNDALVLTVTGAAATNIIWTGMIEGLQAAAV